MHGQGPVLTIQLNTAKWQHLAHERAKDVTITVVMDKVKHGLDVAKHIRPFYDLERNFMSMMEYYSKV